MRRLRSWTLLLLIPLLVSCSPSPRASVVTGCADAQAACLQGLATVTMQTSQGEFTIEVNGDAAPLTSGNFIDLVRRGTYDGTMFHRVVREPVPFVVQGAIRNPVIDRFPWGSSVPAVLWIPTTARRG